MYVIEKAEDLVGKTVAFIHAAQFAQAITIATTDGGIMVSEQDGEEIHVYNFLMARRYVFEDSSQKWMDGELQKLNIVSVGEYEGLIAEERLRNKEAEKKRVARELKDEYDRYLKLKEKYEPNIASLKG